MPLYRVLVTRNVTETCQIEVEADDCLLAEQKAVAWARDSPRSYDWETDDNRWKDIYIGDPGNSATLVEDDAKIVEVVESTSSNVELASSKVEKWYRIDYKCPDCCYEWQEAWSCACDSSCPQCGLKNITALRWKEIDL